MSIPKAWTKYFPVIVATLAAISPVQAGWMGIALDNAVFEQLQPKDLNHLQLRDGQGQAIPFALCRAGGGQNEIKAQAKLTAVPLGARAVLGASGEAQLSFSSGAQNKPPWTQWILDLRPYPHALEDILLPDQAMDAELILRSSPDLRQWSNRLPYRIESGRLVLQETRRVGWLMLERPQGWGSAPSHLEILMRDDEDGTLTWFDVAGEPTKAWPNPRPLALRGARVRPSTVQLESLQVASRTGAWDAWKSRGRWRNGDGPPQVLFDRVGDPEWRLLAHPPQRLDWQMAHESLEMRVALPVSTPISLGLDPQARGGLACDRARWPRADRQTAIGFKLMSRSAPAELAAPLNLRPYALALLGLALLIYAALRLWRRKR